MVLYIWCYTITPTFIDLFLTHTSTPHDPNSIWKVVQILRHTWISGWYDGTKEQAVSEEEVSSQLASMFHKHHAAIHQQAVKAIPSFKTRDCDFRHHKRASAEKILKNSWSTLTQWLSRTPLFQQRHRPKWSPCSWKNVSEMQRQRIIMTVH